MGEFTFPYFYNYPPYFTLQPVKDTREKQIQLWKELILRYCKHHKCFVVDLEAEFPLFENTSIQRKLSFEAREQFLGALIADGRAEWLDKNHRKCLILWRRIQDWADLLLDFVRENGIELMTLEEIISGDETHGTELAGIDRGVLSRAVKILEQRGRAAMFKGSSTDDDGVKFSPN
jgi:ESCRT-II complex subunit VPS25